MRRYLFEIWEEFYYLINLRWDYIRIKKRYLIRDTNNRNSVRTTLQIAAGIFFLTILIVAILVGYRYPSVGFSNYTSPSGEFERGKTFWDWMQLFVIPLILARLAYRLSSAQRNKELKIAQLEKSADALKNYLDYMTKLLIEQDYTDDEKFEGAARLMRARTLIVLESLNGKQKGHLLRFLIETELLDKEQTYLKMKRANLTKLELDPGGYGDFNLDGVNLDSANLEWCHFQNIQMNGVSMRNANLENVDLTSASLEYILLNHSDIYNAKLSKAKMYKADLRDANLEGSYLQETILSRSNLRGANLKDIIATKVSLDSSDLSFSNLQNANLEDADLSGAIFYGANLRNANLINADLTESGITERQLRTVKSFKGAKLPSSIRVSKLK